MKKRIIAAICVLTLCVGNVSVVAETIDSDTIQIEEEQEPVDITLLTEDKESMEKTQPAEESESMEETQPTEELESTETVEDKGSTECLESVERGEPVTLMEESEIKESEADAVEELEEELLDGDPQAGTSMSNTEEEPIQPFSWFQQSGYTGNTYLHNDRFDNGYRVVNGIDVSSHNGTIDWSAVKADGIDYVIIRAGYRTLQSGTLGEDTQFRTNIQGALNAGLKVGVYIFSQAITQQEAIDEANYILSLISGYYVTLPVVIDYEYGANHSGRLADANLDIDTQTAICNAFCSTVANAGYTPMIYANKSMLQSDIRGEVLDDYYKIWLANYTTQTTYGGEYYAWQYSSTGSVNGVSGNVDCNFFYERTNYQGAVNYVTRLYQILLGREPDSSSLTSLATAIANEQMTACDAAVQIIQSSEFTNKGYSNSTYVTKLYEALLIRTPGSSEVENWSTVLTNGVSRKYILAQIAGSNEFATKCSYYGISRGTVTLTENRDKNYKVTAYVMRCYQNILGRSADVSGLNNWTGKLLNGSGGAEIVKDLVVSNEFKNKRYTDAEFVNIIYKAMLGRNADTAGRQNWIDVLGEGVSHVYVINGFAGSTEFRNICANYGIQPGTATVTESRDKNIQVTGFVNRCYEKALGRSGEADGLNNWTNVILTRTQSPKMVAHGFVFSAESESKSRSNEEYVEMLYNLCLGRNSDAWGKQQWLNQLNSGISREQVFWGFANSVEFEEIISSYGL